MPTLREKCEVIWADIQVETERAKYAEHARETEITREMAMGAFGMEPDSVDGRVVMYGDIRLERDGHTFRLMDKCPDCGAWYQVEWASGLEGLAHALHQEHTHWGGDCRLKKIAPASREILTDADTPEGRLILALRDLMYRGE